MMNSFSCRSQNHLLLIKIHLQLCDPQIFSMLFFFLWLTFQCTVWNTYGPITKAVMYAYDWPNSTIAMMANWGTIIFCLFTLPILWMQQKCGLRATVLLSKLECLNTYIERRGSHQKIQSCFRLWHNDSWQYHQSLQFGPNTLPDLSTLGCHSKWTHW